jgi:hypothetical protein
VVHVSRGPGLHDCWSRSRGNGLDRNKDALNRVHKILGSDISSRIHALETGRPVTEILVEGELSPFEHEALRWDSIMVQKGPAKSCVRSITRKPCNGRLMFLSRRHTGLMSSLLGTTGCQKNVNQWGSVYRDVSSSIPRYRKG